MNKLILSSSQVRENLHLFLDHFDNLSSEDRYCRFFHTMGPEAIRDWLLRLDSSSDSHYFFITELDGHFIGVCQLSIDRGNQTAETAISTLQKFRKRNIARDSLKDALEFVKTQSINEVYFKCEMQNYGCRSLYESIGFTSHYDFTEDCVIGKLTL